MTHVVGMLIVSCFVSEPRAQEERIAWGTFGTDAPAYDAGLTVHLGLEAAVPSDLGSGRAQGPRALADLRTRLELGMGYLVEPKWEFAVSILYGGAGLAENTDFCRTYDELGCEATETVGVRAFARYIFNPDQRLRYWVGGGVGWTALLQTAGSGSAEEVSRAFRGPELLNAQCGAEYKMGQTNWRLGGYLAYSLDLYIRETIDCDGKGCSELSAARADIVHWLGAGVRGGYMF